MKGYLPYIQKACGCPERDTQGVEELMRLSTGGTLDHLYPADFDREARHAYAVLQELRVVDPETAERLCG